MSSPKKYLPKKSTSKRQQTDIDEKMISQIVKDQIILFIESGLQALKKNNNDNKSFCKKIKQKSQQFSCSISMESYNKGCMSDSSASKINGYDSSSEQYSQQDFNQLDLSDDESAEVDIKNTVIHCISEINRQKQIKIEQTLRENNSLKQIKKQETEFENQSREHQQKGNIQEYQKLLMKQEKIMPSSMTNSEELEQSAYFGGIGNQSMDINVGSAKCQEQIGQLNEQLGNCLDNHFQGRLFSFCGQQSEDNTEFIRKK